MKFDEETGVPLIGTTLQHSTANTYCGACGQVMNKYTNPNRLICPNVAAVEGDDGVYTCDSDKVQTVPADDLVYDFDSPVFADEAGEAYAQFVHDEGAVVDLEVGNCYMNEHGNHAVDMAKLEDNKAKGKVFVPRLKPGPNKDQPRNAPCACNSGKKYKKCCMRGTK